MDNLAEDRYPEVLTDLVGKLEVLLAAEGGLNIPASRALSWKIVSLIGREWAGQQIYIGKGVVVTERDFEIYREFTGSNHTQLARKHSLTERQIYNVVNRVREWEFAKKQMGLFG